MKGRVPYRWTYQPTEPTAARVAEASVARELTNAWGHRCQLENSEENAKPICAPRKRTTTKTRSTHNEHAVIAVTGQDAAGGVGKGTRTRPLRAALETRLERAPRVLLTFFKAPAGSLESILAAGEVDFGGKGRGVSDRHECDQPVWRENTERFANRNARFTTRCYLSLYSSLQPSTFCL